MVINNANLKFKKPFEIRTSTDVIIIHHTGENVLQTVEQIHDYYLQRDNGIYIGIGYHYYVRKDGSAWYGRPENTVGAHCFEHNGDSIGICFEGDYEDYNNMPAVQYNTGVALIKDILTRHKGLSIKKHSDFNATVCPGKYFPFTKMVNDALAVPKPAPIPSPKPVDPYKEPTVNIQKGSTGEGVKWVQWQLNRKGSKLTVDGIFGNLSLAAVLAFQNKMKLKADGIVGINTRNALKT